MPVFKENLRYSAKISNLRYGVKCSTSSWYERSRLNLGAIWGFLRGSQLLTSGRF